jgi:hypothetical protein
MTAPHSERFDIPGPAQSDFLIRFCGTSERPHTPLLSRDIQGRTRHSGWTRFPAHFHLLPTGAPSMVGKQSSVSTDPVNVSGHRTT